MKQAVEAMDAFKAQQAEYEAYQAVDVFKVEAVEEREVFQRKFNKLIPMADLGGEYVNVAEFVVQDVRGTRVSDWYFELPNQVAVFLREALNRALEAGRDLWVRVASWENMRPVELTECKSPPERPIIAREVVELLESLSQETIELTRGAVNRLHDSK